MNKFLELAEKLKHHQEKEQTQLTKIFKELDNENQLCLDAITKITKLKAELQNITTNKTIIKKYTNKNIRLTCFLETISILKEDAKKAFHHKDILSILMLLVYPILLTCTFHTSPILAVLAFISLCLIIDISNYPQIKHIHDILKNHTLEELDNKEKSLKTKLETLKEYLCHHQERKQAINDKLKYTQEKILYLSDTLYKLQTYQELITKQILDAKAINKLYNELNKIEEEPLKKIKTKKEGI